MKACTQCGKCCSHPEFMGGMMADGADVIRWQREGRHDILAWADILGSDNNPWADLWISPTTGDESTECPFVQKRLDGKYDCTIHDTRPQVCRDYPQNIFHMMGVGCEMLEPDDNNQIIEAAARQRRALQKSSQS